jgi:hypothetical protein
LNGEYRLGTLRTLGMDDYIIEWVAFGCALKLDLSNRNARQSAGLGARQKSSR